MTKSVNSRLSERSQRTRDGLVAAGVALLADSGWGAVTTRAVATLAGSNVGLIHYHFGGLPGLRLALAERASEEAIGPLIQVFLRSDDVDAAFDALQTGIADLVADERRVRLAVQLIAGASHDPDLGAAFRQDLREARAAIAAWLELQRPHWSAERIAGSAALFAALLDGLLLHRALDEDAPLEVALTVLREGAGIHD
ncbi:TetR family transcriptional regulator [Leucobacter zeae]|nr:TetR family transcriptional regulator [Leucobacter zeae]